MLDRVLVFLFCTTFATASFANPNLSDLPRDPLSRLFHFLPGSHGVKLGQTAKKFHGPAKLQEIGEVFSNLRTAYETTFLFDEKNQRILQKTIRNLETVLQKYPQYFRHASSWLGTRLGRDVFNFIFWSYEGPYGQELLTELLRAGVDGSRLIQSWEQQNTATIRSKDLSRVSHVLSTLGINEGLVCESLGEGPETYHKCNVVLNKPFSGGINILHLAVATHDEGLVKAAMEGMIRVSSRNDGFPTGRLGGSALDFFCTGIIDYALDIGADDMAYLILDSVPSDQVFQLAPKSGSSIDRFVGKDPQPSAKEAQVDRFYRRYGSSFLIRGLEDLKLSYLLPSALDLSSLPIILKLFQVYNLASLDVKKDVSPPSWEELESDLQSSDILVQIRALVRWQRSYPLDLNFYKKLVAFIQADRTPLAQDAASLLFGAIPADAPPDFLNQLGPLVSYLFSHPSTVVPLITFQIPFTEGTLKNDLFIQNLKRMPIELNSQFSAKVELLSKFGLWDHRQLVIVRNFRHNLRSMKPAQIAAAITTLMKVGIKNPKALSHIINALPLFESETQQKVEEFLIAQAPQDQENIAELAQLMRRNDDTIRNRAIRVLRAILHKRVASAKAYKFLDDAQDYSLREVEVDAFLKELRF